MGQGWAAGGTWTTTAAAVERRATAFVVDVGGGGGGGGVSAEWREARGRRLPSDPLSRYVPAKMQRSSARRRADIARKRLYNRQVLARG